MRPLNLIAPWRKKSRRKRRANARRQIRRAPNWPRRRRIAASVAGAIFLGGGFGLWSSGWIARTAERTGEAILAASARAGLKVDDVLVEGRARTQRSAIMAALGVARDVPILGMDPRAAKRRLESLPWVRQATVERRLPGIVFVRLTEREPIALWQNNGALVVIDEQGKVISGALPSAFTKLPLLVGKDAPSFANALIEMLDSEPDLRARVAAAVRVRGRRWNVRLDGGIDVRLPEDDPAAAWTNLARMQREQSVLERDVVTIDMRVPDRLVVRTAPGAGRARAASGKDT